MPGPRVPEQAVAPLRRHSPDQGWRQLAFRVLLLVALIGVVLLTLWLDRAGLKDNIDGSISFVDVVYFTAITITSVGYGDIVPVTDRAKLIDTFFITPIRLFVFLLFLGTAYDFLLRGWWAKRKMRMIQNNLHDHIVLVGYGRSGQQAAGELIARDVDRKRLVVIDLDKDVLEEAGRIGLATLQGDATRDAVLAAVKIERARALIIAAGRDDASVLIVLTARQHSKTVPISVTIRAADNEDLAHQAGATTVINPVSFSGLLLAGSTHGPHLAEYLSDLAGSGGRVSLHERPVAAAEVGLSLRDVRPGVGLSVYRAGRAYGFETPEAARMEAGDVIVEAVGHRPESRK